MEERALIDPFRVAKRVRIDNTPHDVLIALTFNGEASGLFVELIFLRDVFS